ncbi:hypothetical protein FGO68_gene4738 [Halteria grandinella]|uniref:Uncharacterized protein n=1 Tax=Halteria grandinella TaxID=5974 RepID=A0A8J8NXZ3_HALGN|nr:hypothetical protein FGO68_gene4738 [Halteria grandinella]
MKHQYYKRSQTGHQDQPTAAQVADQLLRESFLSSSSSSNTAATAQQAYKNYYPSMGVVRPETSSTQAIQKHSAHGAARRIEDSNGLYSSGRYQKYRYSKSQAKIVNEAEMQNLQIEAAANLFYSKLSLATDASHHPTASIWAQGEQIEMSDIIDSFSNPLDGKQPRQEGKDLSECRGKISLETDLMNLFKRYYIRLLPKFVSCFSPTESIQLVKSKCANSSSSLLPATRTLPLRQ